MPDQITDTPKRYQCRHIFTDGHRCGSPCLRGEAFCYYHHTTRRPIQNPEQRRARTSTFHLPQPEDRSAIQSSIGEILQRIAANEIDPKRAGLLLYGLQIASLNLPKEKETRHQPNLVEEIETNPELGTLAPQTEFLEESKKSTTLTLLLESLRQPQLTPEEQTQIPEPNQPNPNPQPTTLPTLQATAEALPPCLSAVDPIPFAPALSPTPTSPSRPFPHRNLVIPTLSPPPQPRHLDRRRRFCRRSGETRFSTSNVSQPIHPPSQPLAAPKEPPTKATKSPAFAGLLHIE